MLQPQPDESFEQFVARRFKDGKLYEGAHDPNGMACLHEAINVYQGKDWSDDTTGTLDLRGLNDAPWSSAWSAEDSARSAARSAWSAEDSARSESADAPLIAICAIFREAFNAAA